MFQTNNDLTQWCIYVALGEGGLNGNILRYTITGVDKVPVVESVVNILFLETFPCNIWWLFGIVVNQHVVQLWFGTFYCDV